MESKLCDLSQWSESFVSRFYGVVGLDVVDVYVNRFYDIEVVGFELE